MSDATTFLLRFADTGQRFQESVFGMDDVQIGFEVFRELSDHQALFVFAEQTVVDQDARQLRSDRFVQQRRNDTRVDTAAETTDHAAIANLLADSLDRRLGKVTQMPGRLATTNAKHEIL